jgi:hypothetical protein
MTAKSLLRLSAAFVGATGVGLIANPGFVVREFFGGGLSRDSGMTHRYVGRWEAIGSSGQAFVDQLIRWRCIDQLSRHRFS